MARFTGRDLTLSLAALTGGLVSAIVIALPLELLWGLSPTLVGIVEEPAKVIALVIIAFLIPDWLSSKTKCALFGGLAGLGFAFTENLMYYLSFPEEWPDIVLLRTFFFPVHIFWSATVGMGLLYIAARGREGYKNALGLLLIPMVLHGLFNAMPILGLLILMLLVSVAVFICIYMKLPGYPIPPEQIGVLVLSSLRQKWVTRRERVFGRDDFKQDVPPEKLPHISKRHFKILRIGGRFYIENLSNIGGTRLDGAEIKGNDKQELKTWSEITLLGELRMKFITSEALSNGMKGPTILSKALADTVLTMKKPEVLAKLVLPNNREIKIREVERVFGREDFKDAISREKLRFISRKHFKIMRENDDYYIQDEGSTNGTVLNDKEIKGSGRRKLNDGDEISIAKILSVIYIKERA